MNRHIRIGLGIAATAASALALAQTAIRPAASAAEAKAVIEARQNLFKEIKRVYEPMTDMLKNKREFDAALIATNATSLQEMAGKIPGAYVVDTRTFKDIKTEARENIWASQADFKAKSDAFAQAAQHLASVARGGEKGPTMRAIAATGKTCGGCHDNYKVEL